jgi:hypothetical protein
MRLTVVILYRAVRNTVNSAETFNERQHRIGHLFQGRFKSILAEREAHLLELPVVDVQMTLERSHIIAFDGPAAALPLVDALSEPLAGYHLWHAARADLMRRLDRFDEAVASYRRALALAGNEAERRFLARRIWQGQIDEIHSLWTQMDKDGAGL